LDAKVTAYFADVIALAQATFAGVKYVNDLTPLRAILRIEAKYGIYRVLITELFSDEVRKYRYYVLEGDRVEAGFDNSPDPRAIRLKYGRIGGEYAGEYVPHLHLENKRELVLTEEMVFADFVDWVRTNVQVI
jgi:hypothetical protein